MSQGFRVDARFGQRPQVSRLVPLGKPSSLIVNKQRVVDVDWIGQIQQRLQKTMQRGDTSQILSADDVGNTLLRIVKDNGQMIADVDIPAPDDHVVNCG